MKQLRKQPACSVDAMSADRFAHDTEPATARWYFLMFPPGQLAVQFHVVSTCGASYEVCEEGWSYAVNAGSVSTPLMVPMSNAKQYTTEAGRAG